MQILAASDWTTRREAHHARVAPLIEPHLQRQARAEPHPVLDFLFTYYSYRPAQLLRWHPGYGVGLVDADRYADLRGYHRVDSVVTVAPAHLRQRARTVDYIARLLRATAQRPPHLACFGLHEWAMVYRTDTVRHGSVPLRLGRAGTDAVVESVPLRCTHYDAYRFFTPDAEGRNETPLTREHQIDREQPGCLHAGMDLYKYCYKLAPLIDSELTADCFELAVAARELDMRASPYDLTGYGYTPIRIETPGGRAEYVRAQTDIARRSARLRTSLLHRCESLIGGIFSIR